MCVVWLLRTPAAIRYQFINNFVARSKANSAAYGRRCHAHIYSYVLAIAVEFLLCNRRLCVGMAGEGRRNRSRTTECSGRGVVPFCVKQALMVGAGARRQGWELPMMLATRVGYRESRSKKFDFSGKGLISPSVVT